MDSNSVDTIFTLGNKNLSDYSVVWSTNNASTGGRVVSAAHRTRGRRRLHLSALITALCLTTHTRIAAYSLTGGIFVFTMFLVLGTGALANPMRHFEVYLGQWSVSGPGRAFRLIPVLDGIGIAICINSLIRAICYCCVAGLAVLYVLRTISDERLPFTYCRDFNLTPYDPIQRKAKLIVAQRMGRISNHKLILVNDYTRDLDRNNYVASPNNYTGRRALGGSRQRKRIMKNVTAITLEIEVCNEKYESNYPPLFATPAYNFFYVELARLPKDPRCTTLNLPLLLAVMVIWSVLWILLVLDKLNYGRLVWNNTVLWLVAVPFLWACLLLGVGISQIGRNRVIIQNGLQFGHKEVFTSFSEALEMSLYIHAISSGSEIILGKGLNRYASGHIDPLLNSENAVYSIVVLVVSVLHCAGAAACAVSDMHPHFEDRIYDKVYESSLWVMPLYSKCSAIRKYSHFTSTLIFSGLTVTYVTVAYVFLKTALHIIFEYKVKLVFIEQTVVAIVLLLCMGASWVFIQKGGVAVLESVDAVSVGLTVPLLCLMELTALLYVYRGSDFISDMNVANEDHTCPSHTTTQWNLIPLIIMVYLLLKVWLIIYTELPAAGMLVATILMTVALSGVPVRACFNACVYLLPGRRRE